MSLPATASPDPAEHDRLWNDRLQDWLDGDAGASEGAEFEAHLAQCERCQNQLADFESLDKALRTAAPPVMLDKAFDARLFASIDALDDSARIRTRERMEAELQANLEALSRGWRRSLALIIPGIIAGIAVALAIVGWFDSSGVSHQLAAEGAQEFGRQTGNYLQMLMTALIGAAVGGAIASWLAPAAD